MSARQGPAFAGLLIAVLCWSGNALVGRAFHDSIPPLSLSFWRWVLATSLLLPFVAKGIWTHRATLRAAGWRLPVLAAMGIASYNSLLYTAAQSTEAINLTLVNTCLPLATFIGAGFLLGEWPLRRAWFGMAVAAGGLLYLISRGSGRPSPACRSSAATSSCCSPCWPGRSTRCCCAAGPGTCWCRRWCCWAC